MESKLLKEPKTKAQKNNNHYLLGIYKAMTKRFKKILKNKVGALSRNSQIYEN